MVHWVMVVLLGLGLAASAGFNATLPLLLLAGLAHFHVAGIALRGNFAWLSSGTALTCLGITAVVELVGDKIPGLDHLLHAVGVFIRPVAGMLAATAVFTHADPAVAAIVGILVGGPVSLGISGATGAVRVASSATTLGCANPFLSALEDATSILFALCAVFAPVLVPLFLVGVALMIWKMLKSVREKGSGRAVPSQ